ncbi:hypothetical protein DTV46_24935, partial [Salmonella enterica subsp. salamae]|nr:hypothetical protein [Salmonella enterica subsp. salamae]
QLITILVVVLVVILEKQKSQLFLSHQKKVMPYLLVLEVPEELGDISLLLRKEKEEDLMDLELLLLVAQMANQVLMAETHHLLTSLLKVVRVV